MKLSPCFGSGRRVVALLSIAVAILTATVGHAQILLQVDDSIPSATVITATSNPLLVPDVPAYSIYAGFDLLDLFTADAGGDNLSFVGNPSTLTTGNGSSALVFDQAAPDEITAPFQHYDLGFYNNGPGTISFTQGDAAFTGSLTLNLSGKMLTSAPSGVIIAGSTQGGPGTVIGEWVISSPVEAPEPPTWMLMVGSGVPLLLFRRLRRS
jgi:hypothetical protein